MAVKKEEFVFSSEAGDLDIHAISWTPKRKTVKGVLQLVHGMAEHIDRYDEMARYFAEKGFAVYGCDHIGHGESVNRKYSHGYFGKENEEGRIFIEDTKTLTDIAKSENPGVPFVLYGHSMGSFIARAYSAKYGDELDAVIYCGTGGPSCLLVPALGYVSNHFKLGGAKHKAKLFNSLSSKSFNKKTENATDFDWLSVDEENISRYSEDPYCGFCFSRRGFADLTGLLKHISKKSTYREIPKELPILIISGAEDPVGGYGKDVRRIKRTLKHTGHKKVRFRLIEGKRHEIHNEENRYDVYDEMYRFIKKAVK